MPVARVTQTGDLATFARRLAGERRVTPDTSALATQIQAANPGLDTTELPIGRILTVPTTGKGTSASDVKSAPFEVLEEILLAAGAEVQAAAQQLTTTAAADAGQLSRMIRTAAVRDAASGNSDVRDAVASATEHYREARKATAVSSDQWSQIFASWTDQLKQLGGM
jgi:hypothetical protein